MPGFFTGQNGPVLAAIALAGAGLLAGRAFAGRNPQWARVVLSVLAVVMMSSHQVRSLGWTVQAFVLPALLAALLVCCLVVLRGSVVTKELSSTEVSTDEEDGKHPG